LLLGHALPRRRGRGRDREPLRPRLGRPGKAARSGHARRDRGGIAAVAVRLRKALAPAPCISLEQRIVHDPAIVSSKVETA